MDIVNSLIPSPTEENKERNITFDLSIATKTLKVHPNDFFCIKWDSLNGKWVWSTENGATDNFGEYKYNGWLMRLTGWYIITKKDDEQIYHNRENDKSSILDYQDETSETQSGENGGFNYDNSPLNPMNGVYKIIIIDVDSVISNGTAWENILNRRGESIRNYNPETLKDRKRSIASLMATDLGYMKF
jgi:hypothetical protein